MSGRRRLAILAAGIVAVASLYFWVNPVLPESSGPISLDDSVQKSAADPKQNLAPESTGESTPLSASRAEQDLIRECLAKTPELLRGHDADTIELEDLLAAASATGKTKVTNEIANFHVINDGIERRLHIEPNSGNSLSGESFSAGDASLRIFDVDSEGLPIPIEFPEELKAESKENVIRNFETKGDLVFSDRRYTVELESAGRAQIVAEVVETNGKVTELQVFRDSASLACAWQAKKLTCKCLSPSQVL
ncbi:MAG: hypothetical protein V4692_09220 [Bdellovibrionota bacterium]